MTLNLWLDCLSSFLSYIFAYLPREAFDGVDAK